MLVEQYPGPSGIVGRRWMPDPLSPFPLPPSSNRLCCAPRPFGVSFSHHIFGVPPGQNRPSPPCCIGGGGVIGGGAIAGVHCCCSPFPLPYILGHWAAQWPTWLHAKHTLGAPPLYPPFEYEYDIAGDTVVEGKRFTRGISATSRAAIQGNPSSNELDRHGGANLFNVDKPWK